MILPANDNVIDDAVSKFQTRQPSLPGISSASVTQLRKNAIHHFEEHGLPNKKMEEWRNSNIKELQKYLFEFGDRKKTALVKEDLDHLNLYSDDAYTLVFLNGFFQNQLSNLDGLPAGIILESISKYIDKGDESDLVNLAGLDSVSNGFADLNAAFFTDGSVLKVPDGMTVDKPIHIAYLTSDQNNPIINYVRNELIFRKQAICTVIESYYSLGKNNYGTNSITDVVAEAGSVVEHCRVFAENINSNHHSVLHVTQHEQSKYVCHNINGGGQVLRNDMNVKLIEEECECDIKILDITLASQTSENHVSIRHLVPNCISNQTHRSVLFDDSVSVFNGGIYVAKDAQKTNAKQSSNSLLLSKNAEINTKPQLEIYADDVKCSHGATVGELNEDMIFYLRSRGISESEAQKMLAYGFCKEIASNISDSNLQEIIQNMILRKLDRSKYENVKNNHYQVEG